MRRKGIEESKGGGYSAALRLRPRKRDGDTKIGKGDVVHYVSRRNPVLLSYLILGAFCVRESPAGRLGCLHNG